MARMMPPLRLPCCQPGARASWRTGSGNLRPVLSADAVFIAHLCQSLHCCGAPHEATAEGWGRSGPHPWWTPWHTVYDARPLTSTFGGIIMHPTGEPPNTSASTLYRSPCRRAVLLLHRIVLGDPCPLGSVDAGS